MRAKQIVAQIQTRLREEHNAELRSRQARIIAEVLAEEIENLEDRIEALEGYVHQGDI